MTATEICKQDYLEKKVDIGLAVKDVQRVSDKIFQLK